MGSRHRVTPVPNLGFNRQNRQLRGGATRKTMHTLVTFATQWGSRYGGINSFNADFLAAFGAACHQSAQIICIVASDTPEARAEAAKAHVQLVALPFTPEAKTFGPEHGQAGVEQLKSLKISFDPDKTVWLGHDRLTGEAAIAAAEIAGSRSAVIHHMSYDHYESYAEDSQSALQKTQAQTTLFQNADVVLAVGPLLRDAAKDRISGSKPVHMLIPGLAEIAPQNAPNTFVAFLSGRLSNDAARIKQGHLGIAAFAKAQREAHEIGMPDALRNHPKLLLRGVDFDVQLAHSSSNSQPDPEIELRNFAYEYANAVINLQALPYTEDRQQLYAELSKASVALMLSWHEGFGLVAWEAIAAGVPLIISKNSGVYKLLEESYPGAGSGCVYPLDILGNESAPYFHDEDLKAAVAKLKEIANNPGKARKQARTLRSLLGNHTWAACAEQAAKAFDWDIPKGSVPAITSESHPLANTPGQAATPLTVPRHLELDYLDWLKQEELLYLDKYTPISGGSQQQRRRARMNIVCSLEPFDRERSPRPFVDAVKELHRIQRESGRAVLLGEPGGGKTTILWKLADDLVTTARNNPAAPIPLLIRLGFWDEAEQSLPEFIAAQLGDLGAYLDVLLGEKRAALLLDGLNELPVAQRAVKYPLVRQFIEARPKLLAVVSCRKEDYAPNDDFDLGCDRINILPLDAMRIRQFTARYLPEQGETFFWKLAGERARSYYNDFIARVGLQHEERFWLAQQPPHDLKWTYDWDSENPHRRWTEWIKHREAPASLMILARNPYMLWMLIRVYAKQGELPANRGDLFRRFVEELLEREKIPVAEWPPLITGLAQVAYAMQSQRAPRNQEETDGETETGNALTVLPGADVRKILDEQTLKLAGSASLLSLGEQVRFTHQLLQEYFAARYLQSRMSATQSDASAFWPPDRWWQRTNWEEVAILLCRERAAKYSCNS